MYLSYEIQEKLQVIKLGKGGPDFVNKLQNLILKLSWKDSPLPHSGRIYLLDNYSRHSVVVIYTNIEANAKCWLNHLMKTTEILIHIHRMIDSFDTNAKERELRTIENFKAGAEHLNYKIYCCIHIAWNLNMFAL